MRVLIDDPQWPSGTSVNVCYNSTPIATAEHDLTAYRLWREESARHQRIYSSQNDRESEFPPIISLKAVVYLKDRRKTLPQRAGEVGRGGCQSVSSVFIGTSYNDCSCSRGIELYSMRSAHRRYYINSYIHEETGVNMDHVTIAERKKLPPLVILSTVIVMLLFVIGIFYRLLLFLLIVF